MSLSVVGVYQYRLLQCFMLHRNHVVLNFNSHSILIKDTAGNILCQRCVIHWNLIYVTAKRPQTFHFTKEVVVFLTNSNEIQLSSDLIIFWQIVLQGDLINKLLGEITSLSREQANHSLVGPREILLGLVNCGNYANVNCHLELSTTRCVHHQLRGCKVNINWRCNILSEVDLSWTARKTIGEVIGNRTT